MLLPVIGLMPISPVRTTVSPSHVDLKGLIQHLEWHPKAHW